MQCASSATSSGCRRRRRARPAAVLLLATRRLLIVLGSALLMAGTIVGFILDRTAGVFGFHLTFSSGLANVVLIVEAAAIVWLAGTAAVLVRRRR